MRSLYGGWMPLSHIGVVNIFGGGLSFTEQPRIRHESRYSV